MQSIRIIVDIVVLLVILSVVGWGGYKAGRVTERFFGEQDRQTQRKIERNRRVIDWLLRDKGVDPEGESGEIAPFGMDPQEIVF